MAEEQEVVFRMAEGQEEETDRHIQTWKLKNSIKTLDAARGNGTSMISLVVPPVDQISRVTKMLADEHAASSNIKSRANRQSVLGAITSAIQRLKLYPRVPPNGLVLYTGTIVTDDDGKERKVTVDLEPVRPINASLYLCDSRFRVDLPRKHGRGGQSANRFARLREESRHNYLRKVAELATQLFIDPGTNQPNVAGLVVAGSADFKTELLGRSGLFDPRLQAKVMKTIDVSYGGDTGFNQAIEMSAEVLAGVKFVQEKKLIGKLFEEVSQDTGKHVLGVKDTMTALEMGAVDTLIVWENLDVNRYELIRNGAANGETVVRYLSSDQEEADHNNFVDKVLLTEWLAENYRRFGCALEFVTDKS
ncbi:hypothetical protein QOZ80_5AG0375560 [Eleusine coracana subsp. coracana]|nr:hypothetical protein QOZ80_5AG0375560 [Eleusine coracana subsp. coracana]